ncbi:hypothetical protein [Ferrimicrobium acidiphilum]|uniref:hypothetical protein n=1 Tax=Ferrimicrobium acidiphilum TaxID=121039 RepID=UPI0023F02807|nr:hypothetical protein [Ferrimicrobium acidiphilum]
MRVMAAPFLFLWEFFVGDQPWLAVGVLGVGVLVLLVRHLTGGWVVVPIVVSIILMISLWRSLGLNPILRRGYEGKRR